jgi:prepilin-type N-terminal cleavage/methylation domain-containing protein/prepilin-type processing-associated H-X9-DG protein
MFGKSGEVATEVSGPTGLPVPYSAWLLRHLLPTRLTSNARNKGGQESTRRSFKSNAKQSTRKPVAPRAFTLVELLVVIAIIGVLVALLLPAVQAAREAGRRAQCQQNLREVAAAVLNYEGQQKEFPVGCLGYQMGVEPKLISWNVQLLPFLEQRTLWQHYRFDLPSTDPHNRALGATVLTLFLCPSTPSEVLISPSGAWRGQAFTDYGGIYGVEGLGRDHPDFGNPEALDPPKQTLHDDSLGVMLYDEATAVKQIDDGTAKTAMIAEALARRVTTMEWANGHNVFAQEQTTPVNGEKGFDEIGSPHPGGALVAFCDGHVEFLSADTDQDVLNSLLTRSGGEVR